MNFEQPPVPKKEVEKKTNIIEATTPDGKKVVIDIEKEIKKQQKFLDEHGYHEDLSKVEVTEEMKQRMKEAIEKGFTELLFVPGIEEPKSYVGRDLKDTSWEWKPKE